MKLAIFDFDGTLFTKETLPFILNFWRKSKRPLGPYLGTYTKIIGLVILYKIGYQSMDKRRFRTRAAEIFIHLFDGMTKDQLTGFFKECAHEMHKYFYPPVIEAVQQAQTRGYHTVICSGNYSLSLQEISKYISFDTIIGTHLLFDSEQILDTESKPKVITGQRKKQAILAHFSDQDIDWQNSISYGDSYYDVDIMELTGNPVAVRPDDRLKEMAIEKRWDII